MNRRGAIGSAVGAGVLALLLLRGGAPGPSSTAATQATQTSRVLAARHQKQARPKPTDDGPWRASQEHFAGMQANECPASGETAAQKQIGSLNGVTLALQQTAASSAGVTNAKTQLWCIPPGTAVQAMIAIAPDPVHTHTPLIFDRTIDAIQLAAGSVSFVPDRYWLPWDIQLKPPFTDYDSVNRAQADQAAKENQPGLMIFRWNGEAKTQPKTAKNEMSQDSQPQTMQSAQLLYVFLVADTATTGINGREFQNAVNYVKDICGIKPGAGIGCGDDGRIRIMGPTWSGSLASLRQLTENQFVNNTQLRFKAYSGTVSSQCAMQDQGLLEKTSPLCPKGRPYDPDAPLKLESFVNSAEMSLDEFVDFLGSVKQIDCAPDAAPQVAYISEAGTTFGAAGHAHFQKGGPHCDAPVTSFRYPREISSLRNAYQTSAATTASAGSSVDGTRSYLPLNLADQPTNTSDEPPDFSTQQGPLAKEAVLMEFSYELRRGGYRYIGISGSNILDVMFLANFLRRSCPDARLFIPTADLLFEREVDNASYIGMLSVATYPMVGENLDWVKSEHPMARLPFSDQYQEGTYNAASRVLSELFHTPNPEFHECREPFTLKDGCTPGSGNLPLWLSVVGTGGYWPVQVLTNPDDALTAELDRKDFSISWKSAEVSILVVAFLHIIILCTHSPVSRRFRDFNPLAVRPAQRLCFIQLGSSSLALGLAMLAAPWIYNWHPNCSFWHTLFDGTASPQAQHCEMFAIFLRVVMFLSLVAIIALFLIPILLTLVYLRRWKEERRVEQTAAQNEKTKQHANIPPGWLVALRLALPMIITWGVAAGLLYCWYPLFNENNDPFHSHYGIFFAYRAMHLASGVSPLMPVLLLLAAIYLWSIFEIWRLRFDDCAQARISNGGCRSTSPSSATGAVRLPGGLSEPQIVNAISNFLFKGTYVTAFILVYVVWIVFFNPIHPFEMFEHAHYGFLYGFLFMVIVGAMLGTGFRLGQIWAELKRFLLDLERSPLRLAFNRIKDGEWVPIWRQGGEEVQWASMARAFQAMRQLRNCPCNVDDALKEEMKSIETEADQIKQLAAQLSTRTSLRSALARRLKYLFPFKSSPLADDFINVQAYFCGVQQRLAGVLEHVWQRLDAHWRTQCLLPDEIESEEKEDKGVTVYCTPESVAKKEKEDQQRQSIEALERFTVFRYTAFVRGALMHIKHCLMFVGISFTLILISLNIYSFEPHQSLIWSLTVIFIVVGIMVIRTMMQLHRDPIVSRMTGSKPNELGFEFYVRAVGYGALPLITLLATHFPSIGKLLVSFLQPGLEALK